MAAVNDIFKCELCGNVVELLHAGGGELVCCGEPMKNLEAKSTDAATEKHVPIIEEIDGGSRVYVGSTEHPMTAEHYIQWIEIINGNYVNRKYLKPGDKPEAVFYVKKADNLIVREQCNVHGLLKDK